MSKSSLSVMSRSVLSVVAMAMGAIVLDAGSAFAKQVAVGPKDCLPAQQHFTTIQAAVNHLATISADNTINVCPGTYPEQITVTQSTLTIKGVAHAGAALSKITIPPTGLESIETSVGKVKAQVAFLSPAPGVYFGAKLINLTIDGTGATCADGERGAGVAFVSIGDPTFDTFAGTIQNVVVRNQGLLNGAYQSCAASDGILSDNSFISITGSIIHDVAETCIKQIGGDNNINNNTVQVCYKAGIWLVGTKNAVISNNVLFNVTWGIKLDDTADCTVNMNTIGPYGGTAIYVLNSVNTGVTSNKVKEAYFGIWVGESKDSIVRLNVIQRATKAGIADVNTLGNNTFTNNTINQTQYGIYARNFPVAIPDILEPNTFLNVEQITTDVLTFP